MPTKFEVGGNPVAGIAVGEFKITRIGPNPGEILRIAYLSHVEGVTCGECTLHGPWSDRTRELIDLLCESLEHDTTAFLNASQPEDLNGSVAGDVEEDPGVEGDEGLTFG